MDQSYMWLTYALGAAMAPIDIVIEQVLLCSYLAARENYAHATV